LLEKEKEEREDEGHEHNGHEHSHVHADKTDKKDKKDNNKGEKDKPDDDGHDNSNLHAVFLHVLGDALGSVGAIGTGLINQYVNHPWKVYADPSFSLFMAVLIIKTSIPLIIQTTNILLQSAPASIEIDSLHSSLLKIDGVVNVHELHVWQLGNLKNIATLHATVDDESDFSLISSSIISLFHSYGVHSTTVQPEYAKRGLKREKECKMACDAECDPGALCCERNSLRNDNYGTLE